MSLDLLALVDLRIRLLPGFTDFLDGFLLLQLSLSRRGKVRPCVAEGVGWHREVPSGVVRGLGLQEVVDIHREIFKDGKGIDKRVARSFLMMVF